uniref:Protein E4 n=1 Tax=Human papillomavirus 35 TaxID=10587 RepID=A0A6M3S0I5_HPV35|nr:E4 [human papillomavirus 35]
MFVLNLYLAAQNYPLLKLLHSYTPTTPPRPIPKPAPWAPQKPRKQITNDFEGVPSSPATPPSECDSVPWTVLTEGSTLHLTAQTKTGVVVVVQLHL